MAKKNTIKQIQSDEVPTLNESTTEIVEQNVDAWTPGQQEIKFVVTRSGLRVSDKEYSQSNDSQAINEKNFWQKLIKSWPDGTRIEIVQYDKKKHRIW